MIVALVGLAAVAVFIAGFAVSGLIGTCSRAVQQARTAGAAMRDSSLDDLEKEKIVQQSSLKLFGAFGGILVRSVLILAASFVPIYLADLAGLASADSVQDWLLRLDVIIILSVVVTAGFLLGRRLWSQT